MRRALLLTVALSVSAALPATAQNLKVDFHDGRVTVEATAVPVRSILTEWGKVGGTKIVGAERITGAPITVKLINVTEAQALETILRSVAGYMAAPRNTGVGASTYDRILVMATSATPPAAAANTGRPQPSNAFNGTQRFVPPRQRPEPDEQPEIEEPDENPPNPPVFTFPQPNNQPGQFGQPVQTFQGAPGQQPFNGNPATAAPINIAPGQPTAPVGVSQPGMMVQPPAPQTPVQPGMIVRPPGRGGNQ